MSENSTHPDNILQHQIALNLLPGIGPVTARDLMSYCGGLEGIFKANEKSLTHAPGVGNKTASAICSLRTSALLQAEEEVDFIRQKGITPIFYTDNAYPPNLRFCKDAPILLFFKGNANLQATQTLSIVGTRHANDYGQELCNNLIKELAPYKPLIISGLAFGIDTFVHRACLQHNLPTLAVLAHGLDSIYPSENREMAQKMLENGGLLTEHLSKTRPDRENFPRRNRIIAGLAEATLVVQTAHKGGGMITAHKAIEYKRNVFAFPGRVSDSLAGGCNHLIKTKAAELIESAADIVYTLNWELPQSNNTVEVVQQMLPRPLDEKEKEVLELLEQEQKDLSIDELMKRCALEYSPLLIIIFQLELSGLIKFIPGGRYKAASID